MIEYFKTKASSNEKYFSMPEDTFQKQVESQHCPTKVAVRFMKVETCQKHSDLEQGELIMIPNSNIYEMGQVSQLYVCGGFLLTIN